MSDTRKRVILSDSSLNRYGYRVLTSGLDIEAFKKNPVMLWAHFRDEGSPIWGNYLPIGHWEEIEINGDELSAIPVFDLVDETSKVIAAKYEAGTLSAASIGIKIMATSSEKEYMLPGQTRETVTKSELMEASIVDIPANQNAVRLYDRSTSAILAAGADTCLVPEITQKQTSMKVKESWKALLSFFNIKKEDIASAELSADNLEQLNVEMERLQGENLSLVDAKKEIDDKLTAKDTEITQLKESVTSKDQDIATLKEQVANLKGGPAVPGANITPEKELGAELSIDDFAKFCNEHAGDHSAITAEMKRLGMA